MRYKCVVSYVGDHYEGWQSQTRGTSVQEQIEKVLEKIAQTKITITASGRTDAGVNARGQVFMFDCERNMNARKWMGAINAFLPDDIHILSVEEKDSIFHARFNVRYKTYTYRINNGPYDVFSREYACQFPYPLDIEKMNACIQLFQGTHDFTSFCGNKKMKKTAVRTIYEINFTKKGNDLWIDYRGNGFLQNMVRILTGTLIEVGDGRRAPEELPQILESKNRENAGYTAPACGLMLMEVHY